ncbi:hypothetical protein ABL78_3755 [Leptomonas seymouri]|uniref:Uncharacterized protein n=1 Tax=Leptomonas seymouri TaxID=5684 RepID=A0A0N1IKT2_LEPSE|nr:hypothetical protein ABL78_3755 [Leptomonas seymouri]|eukprot:KPI87153.1 hypothetical protein ABL78_3755 [Leptomonas seymouri]
MMRGIRSLSPASSLTDDGSDEETRSSDSDADVTPSSPTPPIPRFPRRLSSGRVRPSSNANRRSSDNSGRASKITDTERSGVPSSTRYNSSSRRCVALWHHHPVEDSTESSETLFSISEADLVPSSSDSVDWILADTSDNRCCTQPKTDDDRVSLDDYENEWPVSPLPMTFLEDVSPPGEPAALQSQERADIDDATMWDLDFEKMCVNRVSAMRLPSPEGLPAVNEPQANRHSVSAARPMSASQKRRNHTSTLASGQRPQASTGVPSEILKERFRANVNRANAPEHFLPPKSVMVLHRSAAAARKARRFGDPQYSNSMAPHDIRSLTKSAALSTKVSVTASISESGATNRESSDAGSSPQLDQTDTYDFQFLIPVESQRASEDVPGAVVADASAPEPLHNSRRKTVDNSVCSSTKVKSSSLKRWKSDLRKTNEAGKLNTETLVEVQRIDYNNAGRTNGGAGAHPDMDVEAVPPSPPKCASPQASSPTPDMTLTADSFKSQPKAKKDLPGTPENVSTVSPTTNGVGKAGTYCGAWTPPRRGRAFSREASGRCGSRGPLLPVQSRPVKGSVSSRRRGHHKKGRHRRKVSTDPIGDDGANAETSSQHSLEDSMPNLWSSQRLGSILIKNSSFGSRASSTREQDSIPAAASVSFLLAEEEVDLAMTSSQLMSIAISRRKKRRLRGMDEDFGMGEVNDFVGGTQEVKRAADRASSP